VLEIHQEADGLRVELETSAATATCPICRGEGELDGLSSEDLGVHSAMASPCISSGSSDGRCPAAACQAKSWTESDNGFEKVLARSPHRRANRPEQ
jgi:hypothetical protein